MTTLQEVKAKQPKWFGKENKRFFGDVSYKVLHGKTSSLPFLVRSTYAWTNMLGKPRKLHYRLNKIEEDLTIGKLVDEGFESLPAVKDWLREN